MDNIGLLSFEKNYGYLCTLSATDVVYSLMALLDCGASWLEKRGATYYETVVGNLNTSHSRVDIFDDDVLNNDLGLVGAGVGTKTVGGSIADEVLNLIGPSNPKDARHEYVKHFYLAYDALEKYLTLT